MTNNKIYKFQHNGKERSGNSLSKAEKDETYFLAEGDILRSEPSDPNNLRKTWKLEELSNNLAVKNKVAPGC